MGGYTLMKAERVFYYTVIAFLLFLAFGRCYAIWHIIQLKAENRIQDMRISAHTEAIRAMIKHQRSIDGRRETK